MLKFLKAIFGIDYLLTDKVAREGTGGHIEGWTDMTVQIVPNGTGGANLVTRDGVIASYARARDARRGALRRGLTVA